MFLKSVSLLREKIASFDNYPFSIPAIKSLEQIEFKSRVTFLWAKTDQENLHY
jgi:predicted ATPase